VLSGFPPTARRVAGALLDEYDGWDAASLGTLRAFACSGHRLDGLQTTGGAPTAIQREVKVYLGLLNAL
jgi:hypothetical protein